MHNTGAGEEVRTLDIYLGKVMLYQLSYARIKMLVKDSKGFGRLYGLNLWLPRVYSPALFV